MHVVNVKAPKGVVKGGIAFVVALELVFCHATGNGAYEFCLSVCAGACDIKHRGPVRYHLINSIKKPGLKRGEVAAAMNP